MATIMESPTSPSLTGSRALIWALYTVLIGNALEAFSLGPLPVPWFSMALALAVLGLLIVRSGRILVIPGSWALVGFFLWSLTLTWFYAAGGEYARLMPALGSTPYLVFVALRFMKLMSFFSVLYVTYELMMRGHEQSLIRFIVALGSVVSLIAIYMYLAQSYGLPMIRSNRLSTDGDVLTYTFSYAFYRAIGTFREPSHLAEWLVLPFFLSFGSHSRFRMVHIALMSMTLLLTGSLTGIMGAAIGILSSLILMNPFKWRNTRYLLSIGFAAVVAFALFSVLAKWQDSGQTSLFEILWGRVRPILLEGGLQSSNRDYIYNYVANTQVSLFGPGLGHANILLSQYLGIPLVASFLSLYLNTLYSTGVIGLGLAGVFLARPVVSMLAHRQSRLGRDLLWKVAAFIAWLVMFSVAAEEFTIEFGVIYAIVMYHTTHHHSLRPDA